MSAKEEHLRAALQEVEAVKEAVQEAETRDQEVAKVNLRLKGNLDVRVQEVAKLKDEIKYAKEQGAEEVRLLLSTPTLGMFWEPNFFAMRMRIECSVPISSRCECESCKNIANNRNNRE